MKKALTFLSIFLLSAFAITYNNNLRLLQVSKQLIEENDQLKDTIDKNKQEYDWYLEKLQERAALNGCYTAINRLCKDSEVEDKTACTNTMGYVCQ